MKKKYRISLDFGGMHLRDKIYFLYIIFLALFFNQKDKLAGTVKSISIEEYK